jgi:Rod binding domain-containing protein
MINSTNTINNAGTSNARAKGAAYSDEQIRKVSRQFEALYSSFMLKSMNASVERSGLVDQNMGQEIFTDMLMDKYAEKMSEGKGLGMADMLYRYLKNNQGQVQNCAGRIREYEAQKNYNPKIMKYMAGNLGSAASAAPETGKIPMEDLDPIIQQSAGKFSLDPTLIKAVIRQESDNNPAAVSRTGAKGLMQLSDSTAQEMGVTDPFDTLQNVEGGSRYLKKLMVQFGNNVELALAAYNAGPEAVRKHGGVPPYPETQAYVKKVMEYMGEGREE